MIDYTAQILKKTEQALNKPCQHTTTSTTDKDGAKIIYCLDCGTPLHAIRIETCHFCGAHEDLVEGEYYDYELKRDTRGWVCNDGNACLNRSLPSYYRKSAEVV